ncbi:MAG: hypothetical protein R3B09_23870 [Nannocystaceae bacterium]
MRARATAEQRPAIAGGFAGDPGYAAPALDLFATAAPGLEDLVADADGLYQAAQAIP